MSNGIPGPSDRPILQKLRYLRDPIGYIEECQHRFGDVFSLQLIEGA